MDLEKFWLSEAMMIIMYLGIVITDSCRVIVQRTNNFFRTSNHLVDVARESRTIFFAAEGLQMGSSAHHASRPRSHLLLRIASAHVLCAQCAGASNRNVPVDERHRA
jgi:hypothetical protein